MKKVLIAFLITFSINVFGQTTDWLNYTTGYWIDVIEPYGNDILLGGRASGLVKLNPNTYDKTNFNKANSGIQSNKIIDIAVDNEGVILIGSIPNFHDDDNSGGISMFDGANWNSLTKSNSGIPSNYVQSLAVDNNNRLWVGTMDEGIGTFDGITWDYYNSSNSIVSDDICDIEITENGEVWAAGSNIGVFKFDGENWKQVTIPGATGSNKFYNDIEVDSQGNVWIGTSFGLCQIGYSGDTTLFKTSNSGISSNLISSIYCDINEIWFATSGGGACCFNGSDWISYTKENSGISSNYVGDIYKDNNGKLWFGTEADGIIVFDGINWHDFSMSFGKIPSDITREIRIDNDERVWIATNKGLVLKDGANWEYFNKDNSILGHNNITAIETTISGGCWIGHGGGGLFKFENGEIHDYSNSNPNLINETIIELSIYNNRLWVGTSGGGAAVFDGQNWINYTDNNSGLHKMFIYSFGFDQQNNIWFGTSNGFAVLYNDNTWESWDNSNSSFPNTSVNAIFIDDNNNKWLGTDDGLIVFDGTTFIQYDTSNSPIPNNTVLSINVDENGALWLSTNSGIAILHNEAWTVINDQGTGLSDSEINCIEFDVYGNKWISTTWSAVAVYNEEGIAGGVGIADKHTINDSNFKLYPNPANNQITFEYITLNNAESYTIEIVNMLGKPIRTIESGNSNEPIKWNNPDIKTGLYIVFLKVNNTVIGRRKLIIKNN